MVMARRNGKFLALSIRDLASYDPIDHDLISPEPVCVPNLE